MTIKAAVCIYDRYKLKNNYLSTYEMLLQWCFIIFGKYIVADDIKIIPYFKIEKDKNRKGYFEKK
jgi:hypothetical protein